MMIYGKTLLEIFGEMPWPYKIVVVVGTLFLVFIVVHLTFFSINPPIGKNTPSSIIIREISNKTGTLDPSLAVDTAKKQAYLAFSTVGIGGGDEIPGGVSIRLAETRLPCKNWRALPVKVFESRADELLAPDGQSILTNGVWRYETPSLVYDPKDAGREWKIYAYKYFWANDTSFAKRYGAIVYKYTSDPVLGKWSPEEWIFTAAPDYPPAPYQQLSAAFMNALSPMLASFTTYSRPSVIVAGNNLLMTLSAFGEGNTPEKVILLGSSDHGKSWVYMGAPLTQGDAALIGSYTHIGGASLLIEKGQVYLAAVIGDDKTRAQGTFVFGFSDVSSAALLRDKNGAPIILRQIPLQSLAPTADGGGHAAYHDACETGVLTSEFSGLTGSFRIFKTYQPLFRGAE